jgi:PiT family inorganic phosphate transporter
LLVPWLVFVVVTLAALFAFTSGFHDAANVMATIVMTRAISARKALLITATCEFGAPFFLGGAVAETIGRNIIDLSGLHAAAPQTSAAFIIAAISGAVAWNLITWVFGLPSSSSHALVGGIVGAVLVAYGADEILWNGFVYVVIWLIISPVLGLICGFLTLKLVFYLSKNATPQINHFFNRMQILSSIALALSHGANDVQKPIGFIVMSFAILGVFPNFHIPIWIVAICGLATALGGATGGWRIVRTVGSKFYRLRSVHAFSTQISSAVVIFGASLVGGPVSTTHVVSSSIMGVGAG